MRYTFFFIGLLQVFFCFGALAQNDAPAPTFTAEVSREVVLLGNYIEVTFTFEGGRGGKFQAPDWEAAGFTVLGGPNQSSSFSMINGVTKSSISYSYFVAPQKEGEAIVPAATIQNGGETYSTKPVSITVQPNPDGTVEQPQQYLDTDVDFWGRPHIAPEPMPAPKPKTKTQHKTTRI